MKSIFKEINKYSDDFYMKRTFFIISFFALIISCAWSQELYKTNVTASYYAEQFHGKKTSNGEHFNMNDLTCAHKSLPFNTILKVTNLANGKTVNVRVNDRGPFVIGREIDLSKAAAIKLDMIGTGTAKVKLEIVKKGPNTKASVQTAESARKMMAKLEAAAAPKTVVRPAGTRWDVQIGAFSSRDNATNQARALKKAGFTNIVFQIKDDIIRVAIRDVAAEDLPALEKKLKEKGFTKYTIKQRKVATK